MRAVMRIVLNEAYKALLLLWSYKYNTFAELIQRGIAFLAIGFVLGQGHLDPAQLSFVLPGWIMSFYARIILFQVNGSITEEARTGTLEQMYMSSIASAWLLLGRVCAILIVATLQVTLSVLMLVLVAGIPLTLDWQVLPVIALTLVGLFGFSFVLGGAALLLKSVHSIADLTQDLLLFVNGTFVVVNLFPLWLQILSLLLPTTYGIVVMRSVLIDRQSLPTLWRNGSLPLLITHSLAYLALGWAVYTYCERMAKRQGSLGHY